MRLSVFAADPVPNHGEQEDLIGLCRSAQAPWTKVQVTTVQTLADAGYVLVDERDESEADCHFHVYFPRNVSESDAQRFIDCFSQPIANPVPKLERSTW